MVQNSKVQKCTMIDVSLFHPCPQPKTMYFHMCVERYLEGYTPHWAQWFVYVVWDVCDDNVFLSPVCKQKESRGPGQVTRRAVYLTDSLSPCPTVHTVFLSLCSCPRPHLIEATALWARRGQVLHSQDSQRPRLWGTILYSATDSNFAILVPILQMSKPRQREVR